MTHEIEPIEHYIGGDTTRIAFTVPDEDAAEEGVRKDLSGAEISWALVNGDDEVALSTDDDGVTATVETPSEGEFYVEIDADTGDELGGLYEQWVQIYTAADDRQTWSGPFSVTENKLSDL